MLGLSFLDRQGSWTPLAHLPRRPYWERQYIYAYVFADRRFRKQMHDLGRRIVLPPICFFVVSPNAARINGPFAKPFQPLFLDMKSYIGGLDNFGKQALRYYTSVCKAEKTRSQKIYKAAGYSDIPFGLRHCLVTHRYQLTWFQSLTNFRSGELSFEHTIPEDWGGKTLSLPEPPLMPSTWQRISLAFRANLRPTPQIAPVFHSIHKKPFPEIVEIVEKSCWKDIRRLCVVAGRWTLVIVLAPRILTWMITDWSG